MKLKLEQVTLPETPSMKNGVKEQVTLPNLYSLYLTLGISQ